MSAFLRNSYCDVRIDRLQIFFRRLHSVLSFCVSDKGNIVEGVIALAAHAVKQGEGGDKTGVEMLLRELDNGYVMAELHARALAVAQH